MQRAAPSPRSPAASLAPALLATTLGCGPAPSAREVLAIRPAPPDPSAITTEAEPGLRAVARLTRDSRFFPDARVVTSCRSEREACLLTDSGSLVPASAFRRFDDLDEGYTTNIFSQSGPWPQRAWMSADLSHEAGGVPVLGIFAWTPEGWTKRLEFSDATVYLGAGEWIGGRVITPVVQVYLDRHVPGAEGELRPEIVGEPRFVVISGPPSDELPELDVGLDPWPHAFASLPSGHAFLVIGASEERTLFVDRWTPGERRPTRDRIAGFEPARVAGHLSSVDDPAQAIITAAPDDVVVAVDEAAPDKQKRPAIARFDGRAWNVDPLPTKRRSFLSFRRGPDGTLWVVCGDDGYGFGELLRKAPGRPFERVEIPESYRDGARVGLFHVVDAWPRTGSSIWLIARYDPNPREAVHGLFLLDLPERASAAPARR